VDQTTEDKRLAAFQRGVAALKGAGISNPSLDASVLLGFVTGESPSTVLLDRGAALGPAESIRYDLLVRKRCARIAVSRLIGSREFYSRDFHINGDVLDPRPETELLVEQAIDCLQDLAGRPRVLDVGTGSGAIAVSVAAQAPQALVTATDISRAALSVARRNAECHGVGGRVSFVQTDLLSGFRKEGNFDLILSNPPYISCARHGSLQEEVRNGDPLLALVSGPEGTEFYPPLVNRSMGLLVTEGNLMVEVGSGQADIVAGMFERVGLADIRIVKDLSGAGRVVRGRKKNA